MGNRQNKRLDPQQVKVAREKFAGQLRQTVAETAASLSGKHDVQFAVVCRVLEADGWARPDRKFAELEDRHRAELRELISERGWKPERAAALYGLAMKDKDFVAWLIEIGAVNKPAPKTQRTSAERRPEETRREPRVRRESRGTRRETVVLNSNGHTPTEVRRDDGVLLVHEGGRPFWMKRLSDDELNALAARFFPTATSGYKCRRAVIQVMVGCRKDGRPENIGSFVASKCPGVTSPQVTEMLSWLHGN